MDNIVLIKSFALSVRIVNLYKYLTKNKNEYIMSKQLLRCGTSVGANVTEAQRAQSRADFRSKMSIALKESYEVDYWIKVLYQTEYLNQQEYQSIFRDNDEVIRLLVAICKSSN